MASFFSVSQGSVATYVRNGVKHDKSFIANVSYSYARMYSGIFFDSQSRLIVTLL